MSRLGIRLSRHVIKTTLTDPLSGFFMLKRSVFDGVVRELSGMGFKILLDILSASKTPPRVRELPFRFGSRLHGESKIDSLAVLEFGLVLGAPVVRPLRARAVPAVRDGRGAGRGRARCHPGDAVQRHGSGYSIFPGDGRAADHGVQLHAQ